MMIFNLKGLDFIFLLFIAVVFHSCRGAENRMSAKELVQKSIDFHDPGKNWSTSDFQIHIQEPRLGNPYRFSKIKLKNKSNEFELIRNRDEHLAKYILDESGETSVLFNEKETFDTSLILKYRLSPERVFSYYEFYKLMYGLPISLDDKTVKEFDIPAETTFNEKRCFKIDLELNEPMFSRFWSIFISVENYQMLGLEIRFPQDASKGERIYFEKLINVKNLKLPRIRHWHELSDDEYSGSDIILKQIDENKNEK